MRWTTSLAAEMYRIPLIDYGPADGCESYPHRWGVLLGSGCGMMMGIMDEIPFRYCVDVDDMRLKDHPERAYQLQQFVYMASKLDGIALAGWFSISNPEPYRLAFADLDPPGVVYAGNVRLGVPGEVSSLQDFLDAARRRWDPFTRST
jgi:hypothetical protein